MALRRSGVRSPSAPPFLTQNQIVSWNESFAKTFATLGRFYFTPELISENKWRKRGIISGCWPDLSL